MTAQTWKEYVKYVVRKLKGKNKSTSKILGVAKAPK